ncbi:MAG TPA: MarR family transcriptional regulator [Solirubrobacteraceae bacterium]|nr:MarR family transcriptional regulator [Solirubrobacteraceae bacterium]
MTVKTTTCKDFCVSGEERQRLLGAVLAALRADGIARDALDQAVADRLGINLTDLRCLDVLDQRGTTTAGDLAAALGLTTGAVTTLLDRVERGGYVRRIRDAQDRRRVLVELTERCRRLTEELYGPLGEEGYALLSDYESRDLELIRDFLVASRELQLRHERRIRSSAPAAPRARRAR